MAWKTKEAQNAYEKERKTKRRLRWIAENGPCRICGSWDQPEVDHINRDTKLKEWHHAVWGWKEEHRKRELAKCQVLCHTCHKKKSDEELRKPVKHGTHSGYNYYKCRCQQCRDAQKLYVCNGRKLRLARKAGLLAV